MRKFVVYAAFAAALMLSAAPAVAGDIIPIPLVTAKVGEWVLLRDVSGDKAGALVRYTVSERTGTGDDEKVVLRRETLGQDGDAEETRTIDINLAHYKERFHSLEDKAKQISRERMRVKDNEINVIAVAWDHEDEKTGETREFKIWLSDELPVGGMARFWCSDPAFPATEITDFGGK